MRFFLDRLLPAARRRRRDAERKKAASRLLDQLDGGDPDLTARFRRTMAARLLDGDDPELADRLVKALASRLLDRIDGGDPELNARFRRAVATCLLDQIDRGDPDLTARFRAIVIDAVGDRIAAPTGPDGRPRLDPLSLALRELPNLALNVKMLAAGTARQELARLADKPVPAQPRRIGLTSRLCCQADMDSLWMRHWFQAFGWTHAYHRKAWERAFILQALWEAGMLAAGRRGLGFAVGKEPLSSIFVARGAEVLATDLLSTDERAAGWASTNQNAAGVQDLHWPDLVDRDTFLEKCRFRPVDMNHLPADLAGGFDFVWSSCSFEHLGSIEHGLAFVEGAMACLRPGGVAVHTTEYRLDPAGPRLDNWPTVLFGRSDIDELARRLAAQGHRLLPVRFMGGARPLDSFIDLPPYEPFRGDGWAPPKPPHLRLSVDGIPSASIGLIAQARPGSATA